MSPLRQRRGSAMVECLTIMAGWLVVITVAPILGGGDVELADILDLIWYVGSGAG